MLLGIGAVTCLALVAWHGTGAQESKSQSNCLGLHAGITAQLTQGYSDPSVMVSFLLLNDPETSQNTAPGSWRIVIDGNELKDSDWILGNGPAPVGGTERLQPGLPLISARHCQSPSSFPKHRSTESVGKAGIFKVQQ